MSTPNLDFYLGKIKSKPNGDYIDVIHKEWKGNYDLLEAHHGYIQWLFPNSEDPGVNHHASVLKKKESEAISKDSALKAKVLKSFELMLDFWGFSLKEENKKIEIHKTKHWRRRFDNWQGGHNNLRVCRCFKSLGQLGLSEYKLPFALVLCQEIVDGNLRGCSSSLVDFWIPTLTKAEQRQVLELYHSKRKTPKKQIWIHSKRCIDEESGEVNEESPESKRNKQEDSGVVYVSDKFEMTPLEPKSDLFDK